MCRALTAKSLEGAAILPDRVAAGLRSGAVSFEFLDSPAYERFAALANESFQEVSDRTGIPLDLLMTTREAIGSAPPAPDDRLREDELSGTTRLLRAQHA